jgi:hypothetical protein
LMCIGSRHGYRSQHHQSVSASGECGA